MKKSILIGKQKISYILTGNKKKKNLLMIHGLFSNSEHFSDLISQLEENFNILSIDLPGFGESAPLEEKHSLDSYTYYIAKLCSEINFNNFSVIGESLGGALAIKLAVQYPENVKSVILSAPAWQYDAIIKSNHRRILSFLSNLDNLFWVVDAVGRDNITKLVIQIDKFLGRNNLIEYEKNNQIVSKSIKNLDITATCEVWASLKITNLLNEAKLISQPTLVLGSRKDDTIHIDKTVELAREITNSDLMIFEEGSHALLYEFSKMVAPVITNFLK